MTGLVRVAVPAGNTLGEGVLWCDREQVVYWTDIQQSQLWRYRNCGQTMARATAKGDLYLACCMNLLKVRSRQ